MGSSRVFYLAALLVLAGLGSPAEAAWLKCPEFLSRIFWGEPSPRAADQEMLEESTRLEGQTSSLHGMTGRHLSSTQIALRNISQLTDHYLLLGDIGPLVNLYHGKVRKAELSYLQREQNLAILERIAGQQTQLQGKSRIENNDRLALLTDWEACGLLTPETKRTLETASVTETSSWLKTNTARLEKENRAHEMMMGRQFEEWKQVRKHLSSIIEGADKYLLERVQAVDNRTRASAALASAGLESVRAELKPGDQLRELLRAQELQVKNRLEAISKRITEVETWLGKIEEPATPIAFEELRAFLSGASYLNDQLRAIIAKESAAQSDRIILIAEMELLRNRLRDAREMIELAFKLDRVLGVHSGDFSTYARLVPQHALRPTIENFARVVYNSPVSQRARVRRERWRAVWSFIDGNLLYGKIGAVIPTLGRGAEAIKAGFLRNFLHLLFKDLYLQHAENQYFPPLTLLRQARGDAQKLHRLLENLNAGTKDELLVVFARRADLSTLWRTIKAEALIAKDTDHHKLHDRMVKAEATAIELGTISLINGSSYTRYALAGILNGGILFVAGKWWVVPTAQSVWSSVFGAVTPMRSQRSWMEVFTGWILPEAHAAPEGERWIELAGYDETVEEKILSDIEFLVAAITGRKHESDRAVEDAAQRLFDWEAKFAGRTAHQLVTERCPNCP